MCFEEHSYHAYGFVELASFFSSDVNNWAHVNQVRDKSGHVHSPSYGPKPSLDMYAVRATIQLIFGQECGRGNSTLALSSDQASACFRVNSKVTKSHPKGE